MEFLLLDHCVQDCTDGTDESNCTAITCPENKFVCPKGGSNATPKCIDKAKLCDGTHDCDDGADEKDACCKKTKTYYSIYKVTSVFEFEVAELIVHCIT